MYISRFQVGNYKSFREPAALEFTQGFNIISGQNNAGKTALLEVLGLNFIGNPHRTIRTVPARDTIPDQNSWAEVSFTVSPKELKEHMLALAPSTYHLAKPDLGSEFARKVGYMDDSAPSIMRLVEGFFSEKQLTFKLRLTAGAGGYPNWGILTVPSYGMYPAQGGGGNWYYAPFEVGRDGKISSRGGIATNATDLGLRLVGAFQRSVYGFAAERLKVGRSAHGANALLAQDASNLPEVLGQLQHNPSRFQGLSERLKAILPQVKRVSVRAISQAEVEIVVWPHDPETQREDLVVPLAESGTGIGQVLAILYVALTSDRPRTIIIDEPQSFLHPGAARKLMEFLKAYPDHQLIVATHSAAIIAAANPKTITLARFEDGERTLEQLDAKTEKGIQATLGELGIRLSDLFGADNILWVEGRTEEKCFPLIVEGIMRQPLMGTEILGIRQTGDLEGRDAKKVFEIYRTLAKGASLLPPAVAFILDEECRDEAAKKELFKLSGELAIFLPRRMYENYLLSPMAIAEVANSIAGFRPAPLGPEEVRKAMEVKLGKPEYFCAPDKMKTPIERIRNVDAGTVLGELFSEFSETRVTYQKVSHGVALTEWLIKNAPGDLREIVQLLSGALKAGQATDRAATGRAPAEVRDSIGKLSRQTLKAVL
jgi:predicted ATPase